MALLQILPQRNRDSRLLSTNRPSGFPCRLELPYTSGLRVEIKSGLAPTDVLRQLRAALPPRREGLQQPSKHNSNFAEYTPRGPEIQCRRFLEIHQNMPVIEDAVARLG